MILTFADSLIRCRNLLTAAEALGGHTGPGLSLCGSPRFGQGACDRFDPGTGTAIGDTMIALMVRQRHRHTRLFHGQTDGPHRPGHRGGFDSPEFKTLFVCGILLYLFTALSTVAVRLTDYSFRGKTCENETYGKGFHRFCLAFRLSAFNRCCR